MSLRAATTRSPAAAITGKAVAPLTEHMNVVEASGLGKRYGATWALHECTLAVPAGHVAALVGPNGAGKPDIGK
jgi:ABC-type uncharacterized transport system ATPase subunit